MKYISKLLFLMLVLGASAVFADTDDDSDTSNLKKGPEVQATTDLAQDARLAQKKRLPILLMFSATHCTYCELLENEILKPMLLSGDYTDKVIIRKVVIDEESSLKDFNGKKIETDDFVLRYNVIVTPTMVFIDQNGKELTKRMIGINTIDYFGGDVDNAIERSLKKLKNDQNSLTAKK